MFSYGQFSLVMFFASPVQSWSVLVSLVLVSLVLSSFVQFSHGQFSYGQSCAGPGLLQGYGAVGMCVGSVLCSV